MILLSIEIILQNVKKRLTTSIRNYFHLEKTFILDNRELFPRD